MSIQTAILFQTDGKPSAIMLGQWRVRGPAQALQASAVLVEKGLATPVFHNAWRVAFPTRDPLPRDPIANSDGTATTAFWNVFA